MNPQTKFAVTLGAGFLAFLLLLSIAGTVFNSVEDQPDVESDAVGAELVGEQMWLERNADMLILVVMIFAGVMGVLALVGGEFKWR